MLRIKSVVVYSVTVTGALLSLVGVLPGIFGLEKKLTGTAMVSSLPDQNEVQYNVRVTNTFASPIRLCGGQLNWCEASGCYKVLTPLPITLEPGQEATITVSISTGKEKLSETELVLYADGKGLDGLTPVKIKLLATSP